METDDQEKYDYLITQMSKTEFIWSLLNYKKHLIVLSFYLFLSLSFNPPLYTFIAFLIFIILIFEGNQHGMKQIKKTEPTYFQVIQPIYVGILISIYVSYFYIVVKDLSSEYIEFFNDHLSSAPISTFVILLLGAVSFVIFPLFFSFMASMVFIIPYLIGYQFGKYYTAKSRRSQPNEMLDFLEDIKNEKIK